LVPVWKKNINKQYICQDETVSAMNTFFFFKNRISHIENILAPSWPININKWNPFQNILFTLLGLKVFINFTNFTFDMLNWWCFLITLWLQKAYYSEVFVTNHQTFFPSSIGLFFVIIKKDGLNSSMKAFKILIFC